MFTAGPGGFQADSTLVTGEKDAILIDAQLDRADAHRLVAQILEAKHNLTTVYITHSHPDHDFGLEVIEQAFPKAKLVALAPTVAELAKTRPEGEAVAAGLRRADSDHARATDRTRGQDAHAGWSDARDPRRRAG